MITTYLMCVIKQLFYNKNIREKKQKNLAKTCYMTKLFRCSKIYDTKRSKRINQESSVSGKFVTDVLIFRSSCSQMFSKRGILKNFSILEPLFDKLSCRPSFTEHLRWLLLDFRDSKHFFSAELGIYWTQSHRFLFRTPLKTRVKPQKQPLELFCKKRCS